VEGSVNVDCRLVRPVATPGLSSAKSVNKRPLMGKAAIRCVSTTLLISVRAGSITGVSKLTTTRSPAAAILMLISTVATCPTLSSRPVRV